MGPGWRFDRLMTRLFGLAGLILVGVAFVFGSSRALCFAGLLLAIALFETWRRSNRRRVWLNHCRALPWYGNSLRIVVRDGDLVQEKDFAGDPRFKRLSAVLHTPNGYLVRYGAYAPIDVPDPAISNTSASVYIPHRRITPQMTRTEFVDLVTALTSE